MDVAFHYAVVLPFVCAPQPATLPRYGFNVAFQNSNTLRDGVTSWSPDLLEGKSGEERRPLTIRNGTRRQALPPSCDNPCPSITDRARAGILLVHNLFILYDLKADGTETRDYEPVFGAINDLGVPLHVQFSAFYVKSEYDERQAAEHIWQAMQPGDRLVVVNATMNSVAQCGHTGTVSSFLHHNWNR
jgi:hypothetical protein